MAEPNNETQTHVEAQKEAYDVNRDIQTLFEFVDHSLIDPSLLSDPNSRVELGRMGEYDVTLEREPENLPELVFTRGNEEMRLEIDDNGVSVTRVQITEDKKEGQVARSENVGSYFKVPEKDGAGRVFRETENLNQIAPVLAEFAELIRAKKREEEAVIRGNETAKREFAELLDQVRDLRNTVMETANEIPNRDIHDNAVAELAEIMARLNDQFDLKLSEEALSQARITAEDNKLVITVHGNPAQDNYLERIITINPDLSHQKSWR